MKILEILRKLGILRFGSVSGKYKSYKDMPDELMYDNVYDKKKDLMSKGDYKHAAKIIKSKSKILFFVFVSIAAFLFLCLLLINGLKLLTIITLVIWILYFLLFKRYQKGLFSTGGIVGIFFILVIVTFVFIGIATPSKNQKFATTDSKTTNTSLISNSTPTIILPETNFSNGLASWYEQVWYKPASSGGEVAAGPDGVIFKAVKPDSRSGIMLDLNKDVSGFKKLILEAEVEAKLQTLTGTGWNGREAPVAIAISYKDIDGNDHNLLGENPNAPAQMFWRGFYYLDPTGKSVTVNGIKVSQSIPYNFSFDLMTLDPKPNTINFVSIEGAGWQSREGSVRTISITGE